MPGGMGGPMDFGKSKSKFQEVPETGVKFADVAVRCQPAAPSRARAAALRRAVALISHSLLRICPPSTNFPIPPYLY